MSSKKLSRFLRNEKARAQVLSGIVVAVMMLTVFSGFLLLSNPVSAATTYTENFDDDTEGANPTGAWYSYWENFDAGSVSSAYYQSSPYSFKYYGGISTNKVFSYFNITNPLQPDYITMNVRTISATAGSKFWLLFPSTHTFDGTSSAIYDNASATLGWVEGTLKYYDNGGVLTDLTTYTGDVWVSLNFSFNWTDKTFHIDYNGTSLGWKSFSNTAVNDIRHIVFNTPGSNSGTSYIDDILIHVPDTGGNNPPTVTSPSPSDGATGVSVSLSSWSCNISDADSDTMNWTIQTSPNVGSNSGNGASDGPISCSLSGLQYSTSYTVYVNVTDGTDWTNSTYTFTTESEPLPTPPSSGQPITNNDFLTWDGANINLKVDILNDTANMTVVLTSDSYTGSGWHSNGGPGIAYDGTYYYVVTRERMNDDVRGKYLTLHKSSDLNTWTQVWREDRANITGLSTNSLERVVIRYWNSSYYLYFCVANSGDTWTNYYVKASTPEALATEFTTYANWTAISPSGTKDPWVGRVGNTYILTINNYVSDIHYVYKASNPEFSDRTQVATLNYDMNSGYISYDNSSGKYIYWTSKPDGTAIRWRFFTSSDLENWTLADTWLPLNPDAVSGTGNVRYQDYYAYNESSYIIIMEYDHDGDGDLETCLWDYSGTAAPNQPPTVSITSPSEGATVNSTVTITGTASDSDGTVQSVEVKIDSGSWQTATGTTSWNFSWDSTGVSDGSHTIYARSYDGTNYSTEAQVNVTVNNTGNNWIFSDPNPANGSSCNNASGPEPRWSYGQILGIQFNFTTSNGTEPPSIMVQYHIPPGNSSWKWATNPTDLTTSNGTKTFNITNSIDTSYIVFKHNDTVTWRAITTDGYPYTPITTSDIWTFPFPI